MGKIFQYLLIISLWMAFLAYPLFAEDIYVTGITKITMRTGPAVDHKVIAMLESGSKLGIIEYQRDWTQVKTDQGEIGWVLTRFLTREVPDAFALEKLKKDNQDLISKLYALEKKNKTLTIKNATLVQIEEKYNKLKHESADFLKFDAEYKKMKEQFDAQKSQIKTLENDLNNDEKLWFLSGAGVFIVGMFLGLSTRKKKRSSLL